MVLNKQITKQISALNRICRGPGAVKLPNDITGLKLQFKYQNSNGHMGAKKFWRETLPQIQFHNPAIPMAVIRTEAATVEENQTIPATLLVRYSNGEEKSLDIKEKHSSVILNEFIQLTKAQKVAEKDIPYLREFANMN
ncbi:mitochondrial MRP49p [Nadsonia fulvescens var. elongata DSM 6958]|uniref:Mitochondrial MRP49p n=1 Tax=Nadsonia fulvescens var. elongata DSM 6958 TaxID=857566 RepID=A0A1E3PRM5_9ASCO|nr:mitochondrial MRP49p [Nadsonia fulvescens var. elongata DSM 6958]